MNNIVNELRKTKMFFIATANNNLPKVRPFGSVIEYNSKVYLCTNNTKEVWKQLQENPYVEICGMTSDTSWVRVSGKLVEDPSLDAKKVMLEDMRGPSKLYKYTDEIFKVMYIENPKCIRYSFDAPPVEIFE